MGIFSRTSKNLNSIEFEELNKKIVVLSARLEELAAKFAIYETNVNSLRGLVNRKLSGSKEEGSNDQMGDQSASPESPQTINKPVILPYDGSFKQYR